VAGPLLAAAPPGTGGAAAGAGDRPGRVHRDPRADGRARLRLRHARHHTRRHPAGDVPGIGQGDTTRFDRSLDDVIADEGLRTTTVADLAADLGVGMAQMPALLRLRAGERGGLPPVRIFVPSLSSALRANRAEGTVVGGGLSARPVPGTLLTLQGGFATGPEHVTARAGLGWRPGRAARRCTRCAAERRAGDRACTAAGQFINSIATLVTGRDWLNPYSSMAVRWCCGRHAGPQLGISIGADVEWHRSAVQAWGTTARGASRSLPPVLPVAEGTRTRVAATVRWSSSGTRPALTASTTSAAGTWRGDAFGTQAAHIAWQAPVAGTSFDVLLAAARWCVLRRTATAAPLPAGRHAAGARSRPAEPGRQPLRCRQHRRHAPPAGPAIHAACVRPVGGGGRPRTGAGHVAGGPRRAARGSATIGIGVFRDLLRIDYSHGFGGGAEWRARVSPLIAPLL
jgi:hypothetical protein